MSKCRTLSHTRTRVLRLNAFFPPSAASSTNAVSGICVAPCGTAQVTECSLKHQNKVARQMDCWESLTGKLLPTEPRVHLHQTCVHLGGQKLISTVIIAPNWVGGLKPGFHQAIDYCFTWNHFESQLRWCNFKKKQKQIQHRLHIGLPLARLVCMLLQFLQFSVLPETCLPTQQSYYAHFCVKK